MKKIIFILIIASILMPLIACEGPVDPVEDVITQIDNIGAVSEYNEAQKAQIQKAREAYNKLDQKYMVSNIAKLNKAEADQKILDVAHNIKENHIESIKQFLKRPSSFELNDLKIRIYNRDDWGHCYYIEFYIDFSSQVAAGGYEREINTTYYEFHTESLDGYYEAYQPEETTDSFFNRVKKEHGLTLVFSLNEDNS